MRDEHELMGACRAGNEAAWEELYTRYAPRVARFLYRVGGREADVEELVQQVFVQCFSALHKFRGEASLVSWLFGIATNVARHERRSRSRRERKADAFERHLEIVRPATDTDASGRVAARDLFAQVEEALATLKTAQRAVWVMVELEGLTSEEVSRVTGSRPSTVRARLRVARERVRQAIAKPAATEVRRPAPGAEVLTR